MISIVVPLLNEKESLPELVARIRSSVANLPPIGSAQSPSTPSPSTQPPPTRPSDSASPPEPEGSSSLFEILFVDDGSTDGSWDVIAQLAKENPEIRAIRFRRNFGKAAALQAAFERVRGDIVVTMDADLQDDPAEIPRLMQKLNEGFDVVSGWKQTRYDPWHKRYPSLVFNKILRSATKLHLHDFNCGLKAYRKEVVAEIQLYGEMHRFIPVLANSRGFRVTELAVQHHPRIHGVSKYGVSRILKGFLDLFTIVFLTRFRYRPLHVLGGIGLFACGIATAILVGMCSMWVLTRWLDWERYHLTEHPPFYLAMILFIAGLQSLSTGLLAELVVANAAHRSSPFSIRQIIPLQSSAENESSSA